ncbi:hypothetical protein KNT75_gp70 [Gordonia phage Kabluna]|uniref:Uncharacterized protein n=1 Tax=Gordonia phage Kabluna TaxID=2041511 RepID=A0A2D1GCJ5_9CAUD|nr:hypothetical protein KNT75_gp70 [Gordonia phage Kabluna]ATN89591.1 hypothetical protein SEA_KABLUNA_70 [Gordonia phage Kabluna]
MDDFLRSMGFNGEPKQPFLWPKIEFLYLDEDHPDTPSHVWWNVRAYRIDQNIWSRPPELDLAQDDHPRFVMGSLSLIDDMPDDAATNLAVLQAKSAAVKLRAAWAQARKTLDDITKDLNNDL